MSAAIENPGADPTGSSGAELYGGKPSGAAVDSGEPDASGSTAEQSGGPRPSGDYLERIAGEPDFAVEQVRQKDRHIGELNQTMKKFDGLGPIVDSLGGAQNIANQLARFNSVMGDPGLAPLVNQLLSNGKYEFPGRTSSGEVSDDDEDEYLDDATKALKAENFELNARLARLEGETSQQKVSGMVQRLNKEYGWAWESVEPAITRAVARYEQSAEGRRLLNDITFEDFETIAIRAIGPNGFKQHGKSEYESDLQNLKKASTDSQPSNLSAGARVPENKGRMSVLDSIRLAVNEVNAGR